MTNSIKCVVIFICFVFSGIHNVSSQSKTIYEMINSNQLIVGNDTLIIDKTKINDILKQDEIEGLDVLINGFDETGGDAYEVARGNYKLLFIGQLDSECLLKRIDIFPSDQDSITFNDSISLGKLNENVLSDLECYEIYKLSDSLFNYQKIGVWFKISKRGSGIKLKSIRLHPKIIDEEIIRYLSRDKLN